MQLPKDRLLHNYNLSVAILKHLTEVYTSFSNFSCSVSSLFIFLTSKDYFFPAFFYV